MEKKRIFGLDCVRIMALCLLLWLHYLLRNGFYSQRMDNPWMIPAAAGRIVFMCCVPLFLILTGYLKCGKEYRKGYYSSLIPILISWVLISAVCLVYDIVIKQESRTVYGWLVEFFNYDLANYSWYVEMYIGLALLSPFLNTMWNALKTKRNHRFLLGIFIFLTIIPKALNILKLDGENVLNIIPNYWTNLWFLTYYLIGCYIRTWQPKVKARYGIPAVIGIAFVYAGVNRITGSGARFSSGFTITYNSFGTAVMSVLLFLSVYHAECRRPVLAKAAAAISGITLEIYLISCVFDQTIYAYQKSKFPVSDYWWRGLISTALVLLLSFLSGWLIHQVSMMLTDLIHRIGKKNTQQKDTGSK